MIGQPLIIQGGMGAGVSNWRLARAVSSFGQLGVVSGVALDTILARRLQEGDPGGHIRRALDHFPISEIAERIWRKYYIPDGKDAATPYRLLSMHSAATSTEITELTMVANFVEVWLARSGYNNPVGINYLEKVQMPVLPSIYGAMLGGVSYVLMGAGIPIKIPGVLDAFVHHEAATYPLHVVGSQEQTLLRFDPQQFVPANMTPLLRPKFLAIIASNLLAATVLKRADGKVDGFVVEGPTAGGHNAPPRGKLQLDSAGEAVYGVRDRVDLLKMRELGLPFWLAGGYGTAAGLREALAAGAAGVQVGTAFAFADESGLCEQFKRPILDSVLAGNARVVTDLLASPTNFPFKVTQLLGTVSDPEAYNSRRRNCDLGYLREAYRREDGSVDYRCSAEPVATYVAKGGIEPETRGRKCLCNSLLANIGLAQVRSDRYVEQGLVTAGNQLLGIREFISPQSNRYTAAEVLARLLAEVKDLPVNQGSEVV
jgi:nitronate monooxygenase